MATEADKRLYGFGLAGKTLAPALRGKLSEEFGEVPANVLRMAGHDWQRRKRAWLRLGIEPEQGRKASCGGSAWPAADYSKGQRGDAHGRAFEDPAEAHTTSMFCPVLTELAYRWWCPQGGTVCDPFAGGPVRGVVASVLGLRYFGIELRPEQVAANRANAAALGLSPMPKWRQGDSRQLASSLPEADFLFSCPPYGNLERYSDMPADISAMPNEDFDAAYRDIVIAAAGRLRQDRFAVFVVGEYRDKKTGKLRWFNGLTVSAFLEAGLDLWNFAALLQPMGSNGVRARGIFRPRRCLVNGWQQVLVFVKGDARAAGDYIRAAAGREDI